MRLAPLVFVLAPLVLVLALAGCAATAVPWTNPDLPKEQWGRDWSACRSWADSQVGYRDSEDSSPFRDYDRSRAKKQVEATAGQCMRERGYYPVNKLSPAK